jgi:hypothetical protein
MPKRKTDSGKVKENDLSKKKPEALVDEIEDKELLMELDTDTQIDQHIEDLFEPKYVDDQYEITNKQTITFYFVNHAVIYLPLQQRIFTWSKRNYVLPLAKDMIDHFETGLEFKLSNYDMIKNNLGISIWDGQHRFTVHMLMILSVSFVLAYKYNALEQYKNTREMLSMQKFENTSIYGTNSEGHEWNMCPKYQNPNPKDFLAVGDILNERLELQNEYKEMLSKGEIGEVKKPNLGKNKSGRPRKSPEQDTDSIYFKPTNSLVIGAYKVIMDYIIELNYSQQRYNQLKDFLQRWCFFNVTMYKTEDAAIRFTYNANNSFRSSLDHMLKLSICRTVSVKQENYKKTLNNIYKIFSNITDQLIEFFDVETQEDIERSYMALYQLARRTTYETYDQFLESFQDQEVDVTFLATMNSLFSRACTVFEIMKRQQGWGPILCNLTTVFNIDLIFIFLTGIYKSCNDKSVIEEAFKYIVIYAVGVKDKIFNFNNKLYRSCLINKFILSWALESKTPRSINSVILKLRKVLVYLMSQKSGTTILNEAKYKEEIENEQFANGVVFPKVLLACIAKCHEKECKLDFSRVDLEHICCKKRADQLEDPGNVHKSGNMTLFLKSAVTVGAGEKVKGNRNYKDQTYEEKLEGYKKSDIAELRELAAANPTWTDKQILERSKKIATEIYDICKTHLLQNFSVDSVIEQFNKLFNTDE